MVMIVDMISSLIRFHIFMIFDIYYEIIAHLQGVFYICNLKRTSSLVVLYCIINALIVWNHIGFILDDILFPQWRLQEVNCPLFVVGNARSGTTLFHRLVPLKSETFTSMKLWEILFAVSVTWRFMFQAIYQFDKNVLRSSLYRIICVVDEYVFRSVHMHKFSLFEPEEDEWLMIHQFHAQLVLLFFPLGLQINPNYSDIPTLVSFETLPPAIRHGIYSYYRECLQRHLYAHKHSLLVSTNSTSHTVKSNIHYLSKNPTFTTRIHTISEIFPDCRIVCMIRDPVQSVPSMVSYIASLWAVTNVPANKYPEAKTLISFCIQHYIYPVEFLKSGKLNREQRIVFVSYQRLVNSASEEITKTLDQLYPSTATTTAATTTATATAAMIQQYHTHINPDPDSQHASGHEYSLSACCDMTERELREMMATVYSTHKDLLSNDGDTNIKDC